MEPSTIALIILLIALILFITEKIPLPITAIMAMLAMAFTGVISFNEAFSGFSNRVVFMIIGMSMLSASFFSVGLASKIGQILLRFDRLDERMFVAIIFSLAMCLGIFFNAMIVVAMFAPILDSVTVETNGKISRKMTYLPLAIGSIIGGQASSISASCIMTASGMLANSYYGRGMTIFEPLKIGLPGMLVSLLFYLTIGYKLQKRFFDFPEKKSSLPIKEKGAPPPQNMTYRMWFVLIVSIACIIGFIAGLNMGATALLSACIVIIFRCVSVKDAFANVSWETVFIVAGSLGFAQGIAASGAGQVITDTILSICGPIGQSAAGMCIVMMFIATILSNFMSNTATVTILMPIALALAQTLGADAMAFALACGIGADMSLATPICQAPITYSITAGYRAKDFLRVGGLLNLLIFIVAAAALYFWFFI